MIAMDFVQVDHDEVVRRDASLKPRKSSRLEEPLLLETPPPSRWRGLW